MLLKCQIIHFLVSIDGVISSSGSFYVEKVRGNVGKNNAK